MNGKFPAIAGAGADRAASIPVSIFQPDDAKRAEKRARSPVFQRAPHKDDLVEPDDVQKTQKNINEAYLQFGKPLDVRFAYKVHGAALAPKWDIVWTDDFSSTSDAFRNMALNGVHVQFANSVAANLKQSLDELSKQGDTQFTHDNVSKILDRVNDIIEIDSPTSRLSNLVLDMEHVAVTRMRNLVDTQIRRQGRRSHHFYAVQDLLDLQRFGNNIGHLCRSLRRDDHTYMPFGHLVGKLVCEALYVKGVSAVNYMQLRLMRAEITRALQEAITALMSMDRPITQDKIGQPEHGSLYQYTDTSLLFSQPENKRARVAAHDTAPVLNAELVSLVPLYNPVPGTGGVSTKTEPEPGTEAGIGAVFAS